MTLTINTMDGKTLRLENELAKQALSQIKERKEIITVENKSVMIEVIWSCVCSHTVSIE